MRLPIVDCRLLIELQTAWAASPINYLSKDDAPVLLVHGDADRTVPFINRKMMEAARDLVAPIAISAMANTHWSRRRMGVSAPRLSACLGGHIRVFRGPTRR